ncbi:hypothetical protein FSARC_13951 [Fusarium sarcochroum]|uniref:Uncharacterized protein n=1 Tax=Fusarium sarcochroum TaxID=1208366 RepID=A0A8H4SXD1_9HYPO|nr:hypothetical protein FSARC_13951 [Fusarium sarcochroum]
MACWNSRDTVPEYQSRRLMCQDLAANIPSTVDAALDDLDMQSADIVNTLNVGPFGVLKFRDGVPEHHRDTLTPQPVPGPLSQEDAPGPSPQEHHGTMSIHDNTLAPNDLLQWSDLFNWELSTSVDPVYLGDGLGDNVWNWQLETPVITGLEALTASPPGPTLVSTTPTLDNVVSLPAIDLAADAPVLLKHFEDTVMHQMSSLPVNQKSPWTILNIPEAIVTLSRLTIFRVEQTDVRHANLSNLFGLLAVASYHLASNPLDHVHLDRPHGHWATVHEATYETAKKQLDLCIECETQGPKQVKYKEQLMAMNATLATAVSSAHIEARGFRY